MEFLSRFIPGVFTFGSSVLAPSDLGGRRGAGGCLPPVSYNSACRLKGGGAPPPFSSSAFEFGNHCHEVVAVIHIVMRVLDMAQLAQSSVDVVDLLSNLDFGELSRENAPAIARMLMDVHIVMLLIKWIKIQAEAEEQPPPFWSSLHASRYILSISAGSRDD
jgi:hypothetical protein